MLEIWKQAFDTINHDLPFSTSALNLLYNYLKNKKRKLVINKQNKFI